MSIGNYEGYFFSSFEFHTGWAVLWKMFVQRHLQVMPALGFGLIIWKILSQTGGGRMLSKLKLKGRHLVELIILWSVSFRPWLLAILEMELGMFVTWTIQMVMDAASPVFITWIRTGTPRWVSHGVVAEQEGKAELWSCPLFLWTVMNFWTAGPFISSFFFFFLGVFGNALEVRIWTVSLLSYLPFYTHTGFVAIE